MPAVLRAFAIQACLACLVLLIFFPELVLWLPRRFGYAG